MQVPSVCAAADASKRFDVYVDVTLCGAADASKRFGVYVDVPLAAFVRKALLTGPALNAPTLDRELSAKATTLTVAELYNQLRADRKQLLREVLRSFADYLLDPRGAKVSDDDLLETFGMQRAHVADAGETSAVQRTRVLQFHGAKPPRRWRAQVCVCRSACVYLSHFCSHTAGEITGTLWRCSLLPAKPSTCACRPRRVHRRRRRGAQ